MEKQGYLKRAKAETQQGIQKISFATLQKFELSDTEFPTAICSVGDNSKQLPVRWGESVEILRQLGEPSPGTKVLLVGNLGIHGATALRILGPSELGKDYLNDERQGMSYLVASTSRDAANSSNTTATPKKMLGIPGHHTAVIADEQEAVLKGGENHRIISSAESGNILTGPTSIMTNFSNIRINGLWTLNPLLQSTIPSTIVTPLPTFIFNPPSSGIKGIGKVLKELKEMIS